MIVTNSRIEGLRATDSIIGAFSDSLRAEAKLKWRGVPDSNQGPKYISLFCLLAITPFIPGTERPGCVFDLTNFSPGSGEMPPRLGAEAFERLYRIEFKIRSAILGMICPVMKPAFLMIRSVGAFGAIDNKAASFPLHFFSGTKVRFAVR